VLQLRVFGVAAAMADVATRLQEIPGSRHVVHTGNGDTGDTVVTADLLDSAADHVLAEVRRMGVPASDITLVRMDSIAPAVAERPGAGVVWADLLTQANVNARPLARYMAFMVCAGVIAAFGVIYSNVTLVVGAMAISPDTLPISAAATAIVLGRGLLTIRAVAALLAGLGAACMVGGILTFALNHLGLLRAGFEIGSAFLQGLSTVNVSTPIVAFTAGVAGMLALETRASSAVGVAISVTTIPASAYLGVAAGVGEVDKAVGALLVLGVNIIMLLVGGSLTLIVQRSLGQRDRQS
jgi:uncharacterized hydrophobic protein (TIGR00271 family)